jgi:Rad4 transglutaminase-like domain
VAHQKWIPVDPLTTHSVGKPFKLEPPASESTNSMSYVVAFEDDGNARDVTKRYAKAINAKTRKARVEITKGGERWWKKAMGFFEREFDLVCLAPPVKVITYDGNSREFILTIWVLQRIEIKLKTPSSQHVKLVRRCLATCKTLRAIPIMLWSDI